MPVLPSYSNQSIICCANQLTGFYMRATLALNGLISTRVLLIHTIPVTPFAVQFVTKEIIVGIVWSHSRLPIVQLPTQNKRKWWYFAFLFFFEKRYFFTKKISLLLSSLAQNTELSSNFLMLKFFRKAQFSHCFGRIARS